MNAIKNKIKELAFSAVAMAEETLTSSCGVEKKEAAINYIISMLPIPIPFKSITTLLLSKLIDEAIENAVKHFNEVRNTEA